jgi:predicted nucleic acid-binding protein
LDVISDAIHATMLAEAVLRFGLETVSVRRFLKRNFWRMKELSTFVKSAESLLSSRIERLPVDPADVLQATHISCDLGLLTNDAIIVALMQRHGIAHIATNDDDFDRVPGITVWKPRP